MTTKNINIPVNLLNDPEGILHIDSTVLKKAEEKEPEMDKPEKDAEDKIEKKLTKKEQAELLREKSQHGRTGRGGWENRYETLFR